MKNTYSRFFLTLFFVITVLLASVKNANAYLDLGTGNQLFQLLIASLVGALVVVKLYWLKVKSFFTSFSKKKKRKRPGVDR